MGCSPTKIDNKAAYISSLKMTSSKIQTLNEFKITEGMLVQESKEDLFKVYEQIKILGEGTYGKVFLAKHKISNVL
jgi:serine/threonine protein kinase